MLDSRFQFPFAGEEAYRLSLPRCATWSTSTKKVLIIMQSVDGRDLHAGGMLLDKGVRTCVVNAIKHSRKITRTYRQGAAEAAFAVVNFNAEKHLHLSKSARVQAEQEFGKRVIQIIEKLKPTHILVSGDEAMHTLFPEIAHHNYKRGWVYDKVIGGHNTKVVSTLDFSRLLEKDGQWANLLGYWCRHLSHLMLGKHMHDISHVKAEPRYVDTIAKFDKLMDVLYRSKEIAVDTETKDLSVLFNRIYTIQFATDLNPLVGYVLALRHPMTHWTKDELNYIRRTLKKFFAEARETKRKLLLFFNGMFDLRVIRRELKIPMIWHDAWEITSGEHDLDENITELTNYGTKPGNLAAVLCSYGNDFYLAEDTKFSKKDRVTVGNVAPNNPDFLRYAAMDVVCLLAIKGQQLAMAEHQDIEGRVYRPYFERHMIHQMSDTCHQLSHMREDGSKIDVKYLRFLTSPESPIKAEIKKLDQTLRAFPQAQAANATIMGDSGLKARGWIKNRVTTAWGLSLTKPAHLKTLFFKTMGLEPVSQTKGGEDAVDKAFIEAYKDKNPIVATYGERKKLTTLLSSYAKGWLNKLRVNIDSIRDHHLRPDYSAFDVTTGRLASKRPSLHTVPSRGALAKIIKRMFVTMPGYILLRYDYSAHEVRVWSFVGMDMVLAGIFRVGQQLRQAFIVDPSDENKAAIKLKGDIHILNVKRLLNKIVDKSSPLRDAIKGVIFGLIYGMSAETLGVGTKTGDIAEIKKRIGELMAGREAQTAEERKAADKAIAAESQKLEDLMAEDRTDYAQSLIDKIFKEFKKAGQWTNKMKALAESDYIVYSPIGRIRHLYAAMTGDRKVVAQQVRRGSNAPIQGLASEIGVKAGRVVMAAYYKELPKLCELLGVEYDPWELRVPFNRMVHDASYYSVPYSMLIPYTHILQWGATYGVTEAYEKEFGFKFTVEPEIEMEFGARDDRCEKCDWSFPSLISCIEKSVRDAVDFGLVHDGDTYESIMDTILKPYRSKKCRAYLQDNYPMLNVPDLESQIRAAVKDHYARRAADAAKVKEEAQAVIAKAKAKPTAPSLKAKKRRLATDA